MIDSSREDTYQPGLVDGRTDMLILLSGCSGAGKSTLLARLRERGFPVYEEPGRQVVKEQHHIGGSALPWENLAQFVELTVSRSIHHMIDAARRNGPAFFDRGIIDQISGLRHAELPVPGHLLRAAERLRYHRQVFMLPPWREIFANDSERRHSFSDALAAYDTLLQSYAAFGYEAVIVPKGPVADRVEFILGKLHLG